jgi:transposase
MYVQCSRVYQKKSKTLSFNRKLVESYRDPQTRKPRNRTVKKLEQLPILERARLILQHGGSKHLRTNEWQELNKAGDFSHAQVDVKVGDVYSGAGSAVAYYNFQESGLLSALSDRLSKTTLKVVRELVLHQLLNPGSKSHFIKARKCEYLYGLEGKPPLSETTLYRAMDELESQFVTIREKMNTLKERKGPILLYDLSNSYFCGTKAELGGYGQSKEKRHDRHIVTYGLVTDQQGQPLDIKVWKGGTADANTVVGQFTDWQAHYRAEKGIWIADRGMSGEENIAEVTSMGLDYITGVPGPAQIALLKEQTETSPGLFDQRGLTEFEHENKRYVLCRHDNKGFRRESQYTKNRRKVYQALSKVRASPQNKNKEKLYHRAMKALEQYSQTPFWEIEVKPFPGKGIKAQPRYQLIFKLNRHQVKLYNQIGHYYLLQTSLDKQTCPAQQVHENYKGLHRIEQCFRQLKDSLDIRPIRHWREKRIKAHIYLSFLSLWLLKYIERQWRKKKITSDVKTTLCYWNDNIKLCQLLDRNNQQVNLKWNWGENARHTIKEIESYGELFAIKPLL